MEEYYARKEKRKEDAKKYPPKFDFRFQITERAPPVYFTSEQFGCKGLTQFVEKNCEPQNCSTDESHMATLISYIPNNSYSLYIAMYHFKSDVIWGAVRDAIRRGIKIKIILDQSDTTSVDYLRNLNKENPITVIKTRGQMNKEDSMMHCKFMVAINDQKNDCFLVHGSLNFGKLTFLNYEQYRLTSNMTGAELFISYFETILEIESQLAAEKTVEPLPRTIVDLSIASDISNTPIYLFTGRNDISASISTLFRSLSTGNKLNIAMNYLTSSDIISVLNDLALNGVEIRIMLDFETDSTRSRNKQAIIKHKLNLELIKVRFISGQKTGFSRSSGPDGKVIRSYHVGKMHSKFFVVEDLSIVGHGSYHFSVRAETHHYEHFEVLRHEELSTLFATEFNKMWEHSEASGDYTTAESEKDAEVFAAEEASALKSMFAQYNEEDSD